MLIIVNKFERIVFKMKKTRLSGFMAHLAGWLMFLIFPFVFFNASYKDNDYLSVLFSQEYVLFGTCYFLLYYINSLVLVPYFFFTKRYLIYVSAIGALFFIVYFLHPFHNLLKRGSSSWQFNAGSADLTNHERHFKVMPPPYGEPHYFGTPNSFQQPPPELFEHLNRLSLPPPISGGDTTSMFLFIVIIGLSTSLAITKKWQVSEQKAANAEIGKAHAELSFLKAQINPHFLFNTLNNIYTLAIEGDLRTADSIMKLSNIMRYLTEEVTQYFVPLVNEIECIDNYIDLQRLRIGQMTMISYNVSGAAAGKLIAPLVFMTFIENVFKHGISKQENSNLIIRVEIKEEVIGLFCQNPIYEAIVTEPRRGIGILNTMQRLEHLYPGRHVLNIERKDGLFTINLKLNILT